MEYIKGPDFPTGGIIMGRTGIRAAYGTAGDGLPSAPVRKLRKRKTAGSRLW